MSTPADMITFDMLLDDVLLIIFDFYMDEDDVDEDIDRYFEPIKSRRIMEWKTLAHVCRRWRSVVFQSPRRLNLRLLCTRETPAKDTLDIWPPLPVIIRDAQFLNRTSDLDNIIAALEHNDRVCQIQLEGYSSSEFQYVMDSTAMHKPFPELTDLYLGIYRVDGLGPILPDSFLGGAAPRLRSLALGEVRFPGLPKLLLSATQLVLLDLGIPPSGYFPPEVMATTLSALNSLEHLRLQFRSPGPRPALETRRLPPPPLTRSILPSLTKFRFKGASEYLEEILARIDAPRLNELRIFFFNQIIFDTPQLFQFINRRPTLRAPEKGHITFDHELAFVKFPSQTPDNVALLVVFSSEAAEWRLSCLEQVCTSSLPPISTLEDLYIDGDIRCLRQDIENTLWLDLLHSFVALKNLYLSGDLMPYIAPALQELVGGRTTEVLPTLENIFLEGYLLPLDEDIEKFVAARRLTSHPVAVSLWDRN